MTSLESNLRSILSEKESKIIPENIKKDVQIFDVVGTLEEGGIDTSDATATVNDLSKDKTAYVNGEKIIGTVKTYTSGYMVSFSNNLTYHMKMQSAAGEFKNFQIFADVDTDCLFRPDTRIGVGGTHEDLANAIELTPDKIKSGETILSVEGTYEGIDTSDATATAEDITVNKTAYVNGQKVTGNLPLFPNSRTFTVDGGVTNDVENNRIQISTINSTKQILDTNLNMEFNSSYSDIAEAIGLTADKIKSGETILGVTGTYTGETI